MFELQRVHAEAAEYWTAANDRQTCGHLALSRAAACGDANIKDKAASLGLQRASPLAQVKKRQLTELHSAGVGAWPLRRGDWRVWGW